MKFYLDTEFIEGSRPRFWGGQTAPTIELISIGICNALDDHGLYLINKDFDFEYAWNKAQYTQVFNESTGHFEKKKEYWLRENVLKNLFPKLTFDVNPLKEEIKTNVKTYGVSRKEMKQIVLDYVLEKAYQQDIEFCGYYSDYDWVVFCWLFGDMMKLPKRFPMHCTDLKQELDRSAAIRREPGDSMKTALNILKAHPCYPKQFSCHNAIDDAEWIKSLDMFLTRINFGKK